MARARFHLVLTLTAKGGYWVFAPGLLLRRPAALFGTLARALGQPILSRGVNRARQRLSEASQRKAQLNFPTTVLIGGQEAVISP